MAASGFGWQRAQSVEEWLIHEPFRFEFLQAVRLLQAIEQRRAGDNCESEIRFRSRVAFDFPASEVQAIAGVGEDSAQRIPEITVNFLGLAGVLGPLPQPYTEMIINAMSRKDFAAADFLDLFNHRLIWLFYRAHKAHKPALTVLAPDRGQIAQYLYSLIGLGVGPGSCALRNRLGIADRSLLYYSGLFAGDVRSAAGLERVLSDYFDVPVQVFQFMGTWRDLERSQWTAIGETGRNQVMGDGAVLGRRAWDQSGGVTIQVGPIGFEEFRAMLPGERANQAIERLARFYLGLQYRIRIRLLLLAAEVPKLRLGAARLGYTSWLLSSNLRESVAAAQFQVCN